MKRLYILFAAVFLLFNTANLFAYFDDIEIDVWRTSSYEDYCDYEEVDFFIRASQDCYIAVLMVDPDGYANMIYPNPGERQYMVRRGHRYRLSELMRGDPLYFYGMDGSAFITVAASRHPVHADRWFVDEFTSFVKYEYGPSFTIDLQFGHGFRIAWHKHLFHRGFGVVSVPFIVHHYYHPSRSVYYHSRKPRISWERRWKYRSHKPVFINKSRPKRHVYYRDRDKKHHYYDYRSKGPDKNRKKEERNRYDRRDERRDKNTYKKHRNDVKKDEQHRYDKREKRRDTSSVKKRTVQKKNDNKISTKKRTPNRENNGRKSSSSKQKKNTQRDSNK